MPFAIRRDDETENARIRQKCLAKIASAQLKADLHGERIGVPLDNNAHPDWHHHWESDKLEISNWNMEPWAKDLTEVADYYYAGYGYVRVEEPYESKGAYSAHRFAKYTRSIQ